MAHHNEYGIHALKIKILHVHSLTVLEENIAYMCII